MVKYNSLKITKQDRSMSWNQVKRKYPSLSAREDMDNDGVKNYKDCRPLDPTRHGIFSAIAGAVGAMTGKGTTIKAEWKQGMAQRPGKAIAKMVPTPKLAQRVMTGLYRQSQQAVGRGKFTTTQLRQSKALRKGIQNVFPMIPQKALLTYAQASESKGRGRPKGAYATEYAPYGGVYGWRKFDRAQKAAQKYQAILQQAQQRMAQIQQVPIQTGQEVVMQYQQVQPQQQYQQLPQIQTQQQPQFQQPQQFQQYQPQKPPIATVFKSYGGHPFPPVNPPLQRTPQSNTYEDTDSFTGQRIIRQRPQAEAWIRPKYGGQ